MCIPQGRTAADAGVLEISRLGGGSRTVGNREHIMAIGCVADEYQRLAVWRDIGARGAATQMRESASARAVERNLIQIERLVMRRDRHDECASVAPPRRGHDSGARVGGDNAHDSG